MNFVDSNGKMNRLRKVLRESGDLYTVEDILNNIHNGDMQSFVGENGSWVVTQIFLYPRKKVVYVVAAVGELDDIVAMEHSIENFAREQGCAMVMASGRDGWDAFKTPGWRKAASWYTKELT